MTALEAAEAAMCRPWKWGKADCCTGACDAFLALHGIDPMAPLRGRYASEAEAEALIDARGGWAVMTQGLADAAGLAPASVTSCDAGLIGRARWREPKGWRRGLVLSVGGGAWAGKSLTGMVIRREGVTAAWRI